MRKWSFRSPGGLTRSVNPICTSVLAAALMEPRLACSLSASPPAVTSGGSATSAIDTSQRATESGPAVGATEGVASAVLRGIAQLFLTDSVVTGIIILVAILVCSRIAAALALLGSVLGMSTGLFLGADGYEVYHGLWGFNSFVSAVAIGGVFVVLTWRSAILAAACAVVAALLFAALSTLLSP